jgi:hypothetical protein
LKYRERASLSITHFGRIDVMRRPGNSVRNTHLIVGGVAGHFTTRTISKK